MYKFNIFFTVKTAKESGRKFKSFYTNSTKEGKSISVRFTKEVKEPEKPVCLTVDPKNVRISSKGGYDTLVISGYNKADEIEDTRVKKYFDEVEEENENKEG